MVTVQILALGDGKLVTDKATGMKGMLTHCRISPTGNREYIFQPHGISPEDGHPVKMMMLDESRIKGGKYEEMNLPMEVLNTEVEDAASGVVGIATYLVIHLSGCVHAEVQPRGKTRAGGPIAPIEFDIRRLRGPKVPQMTVMERKADQARKPSPAATLPRRMFGQG